MISKWRLRLQSSKNLLSEFNKIQNKIEMSNNSEEPAKESANFEDMFYEVIEFFLSSYKMNNASSDVASEVKSSDNVVSAVKLSTTHFPVN